MVPPVALPSGSTVSLVSPFTSLFPCPLSRNLPSLSFAVSPSLCLSHPPSHCLPSQAGGDVRHHRPPGEGPETRALPPYKFLSPVPLPPKHPSSLSPPVLSAIQPRLVRPPGPHPASCDGLSHGTQVRASATNLTLPLPPGTPLAWHSKQGFSQNELCSFTAPGLSPPDPCLR